MPIHLIARLKTRAVYFFRGLAVSIIVLSITGYFGRFNVFLDITSNFKIQYLILGILLCIFFTITHQRTWLIISHTMQPLMFDKDGFKWRNQHLEEGIGRYVKHLKTPVILMGDLNITMWSPYYKKAIHYSGLRNARAGFGLLPTFPAGIPGLSIPIDHCLVSPDISVLNTKTGNYVGSDHLPIITDVTIPNN